MYVTNRVQRIRKFTIPEQWNYVPTQKNPADLATRPILADNLKDRLWFSGPQGFLDEAYLLTDNSYPLVNPVKDKELRPTQDPCILKTSISTDPTGLGSHRFQRFSNWRSLIRAIAFLILHIRNRSGKINQYRNDIRVKTVELNEEVTTMIIRTVQRDIYAKEISHLEQGRIMAGTTIGSLDPYLDDKNILRVGGGIRNSCIEVTQKHPILIPGNHHIAKLLISYYHKQVHHQGRHFTAGAVRQAGYRITGAKRLISSLIFRCVQSPNLRGPLEHQKMSDLPKDRLEPGPPFTNVGLDVFGPWNIVARRTRGGCAQSKRWAVLFSCLTTRAAHIELIAEMSSSAFINALRRFISIRGEVKLYRSDRGTNFVGATEDLGIQAINVEDRQMTTSSRQEVHGYLTPLVPPTWEGHGNV